MDQEKIGKFIKQKRREKELTQEELASNLRVSSKTISKWENGRSLPDYSLLLDLCKELDMSINELLSGEEIKKENYQTMLEENIIKTIDYNNKKRNKKNRLTFVFIVLIIGLLISIGYKLFFIHLYNVESMSNDENYSNPSVNKIEIKNNDKANVDVLDKLSIYIPEGYIIENDITKSSLVKSGCALFKKENSNDNFIQLCIEYESLGSKLGDLLLELILITLKNYF